MLLCIRHTTTLRYSAPVAETVFEVRMAPPSDEDQTNLRYELRTTPRAPVTSFRDGFGNRVDLFNLSAPYQELCVQATSYVRTHRRRVVERLADVAWPGRDAPSVEALEFLRPSPLVDPGPALESFVASLPRSAGSLAEGLPPLLAAVSRRLRYEKRVTSARTPLSEALELGRGVCQDFAHLFVGTCRALGLPARYVSGYVNHPGEAATHAWCQIWASDRVGWLDVDPTTGEFPGDDHIVTAVGRDYSDVPPNQGVWKGRAEESMSVLVTVEPIDRVPLEWNEWAVPPAGPGSLATSSQFQSQSQSQGLFPRQAMAAGSSGRLPDRPAYPNQPRPRARLLQQQGQQQQ